MIFCDMDGVLVDFDSACKENFGKIPTNVLAREIMWRKLHGIPDYWQNLPKKCDADKLLEYLSQFEFKILTGLPVNWFFQAEIGKREWVKKNVGDDIHVICCLSKNKYLYGQEQDILIDDQERNIESWRSMGGIGILHQNAEQTIAELKLLGY